MNIVFDLDGTLAKSTPYHKAGWQNVLTEIGIKETMDTLLPYEPGLKERFDSYRRLKTHFFKIPTVNKIIKSYFQSDDENILVRQIMDLKESLTIMTIYQEKMHDILPKLASNLTGLLDKIKNKGDKIGIISSSRATIISALLFQSGVLVLFDFIVGEELLTNESGLLFDKPDAYAQRVVRSLGWDIDVYIGDNDLVDKEFAENCGAKYIYADNQTDFSTLINSIYQ